MENLFKTRIGRKVDGVEAAKAKSVRKSLKIMFCKTMRGEFLEFPQMSS